MDQTKNLQRIKNSTNIRPHTSSIDLLPTMTSALPQCYKLQDKTNYMVQTIHMLSLHRPQKEEL